jgi:demethylmenaquinone methyltransferase/2-methoxy-6-polyprenyl-1,4-benzoquinol methylase
MTDTPEETAPFGFRTVAEGEKQGLVNEVFSKVAERYDQMNDLMSAGLHRLWKDEFVTLLSPPRSGRDFKVIDVAGGTGDIAFRIARAGGTGTHITIADISPEMVAEGAKRADKEGLIAQCDFTVGNAEALAFPDKSFDAYTIAFGIRNVPRIEMALSEACRVLKRGGRFLCLEFSTVELPGLREAYRLFSDVVIPPMGRVVTGDSAPYKYLIESIQKFPRPEAFSAMIAKAGFKRVTHTALSGNIAALHAAWKL